MKLHEYLVHAPRIKTGRTKHRLRHYIDAWQKAESEMATVTTSNLNAGSNGEARPAQLKDNGDNLNLGEKQTGAGGTTPRVSPDPKAVDNGQSFGTATDGSVGPVVIKQVDHNALEGSNKGDHRTPGKPAETDALKGNDGNPRQQMRQQESSRNDTNGAVFTSDTSDSEGGRA